MSQSKPRLDQESKFANDLFSGGALAEPPFEYHQKTGHSLLQLNDGFAPKAAEIVQAGASIKSLVIQVQIKSGATTGAEAKALEDICSGLTQKGVAFKVYPVASVPSSLSKVATADYRTAMNELGILAFGQSIPEVIDVFRDSMVDRLSKQLRVPISFQEDIPPIGKFTKDDYYSASIDFEGGSVAGSACVSIQAETLRKLVSKMTGEEQVGMNEVVVGGLGEFVNIIAGGARGDLCHSGYSIRLSSLPQIISPEFQGVRTLKLPGVKTMQRFGSPDGELLMELTFLQ